MRASENAILSYRRNIGGSRMKARQRERTYHVRRAEKTLETRERARNRQEQEFCYDGIDPNLSLWDVLFLGPRRGWIGDRLGNHSLGYHEETFPVNVALRGHFRDISALDDCLTSLFVANAYLHKCRWCYDDITETTCRDCGGKFTERLRHTITSRDELKSFIHGIMYGKETNDPEIVICAADSCPTCTAWEKHNREAFSHGTRRKLSI